MASYANPKHFDFAFECARCLPSAESLQKRSDDYWAIVEVNAPRIVHDAEDVSFVEKQLRWLGLAGLRTLGIWFRLDATRSKEEITRALSDHISSNREMTSRQLVLFLIEFLARRRTDPIEEICQILLPENQFRVVQRSVLDDKSKKFCYALLVFIYDHRKLRLLMNYETAERVGYTRYSLMANTKGLDADNREETSKRANEKVKTGVDLEKLDSGKVNKVLESFDAKRGGHGCLCFDIFHDHTSCMSLTFILRYLRESRIREIDGVVFADEAELIVLRQYEKGRVLLESSNTGIGPRIAAAIVMHELDEPNLEYVPDKQLTERNSFGKLLLDLASGKDPRARLHELQLKTAPIEGAPILMLRSSDERGLAEPLKYIRKKDIHLLRDPRDIRHITITFVAELAVSEYKPYGFKVFCEETTSGQYYLPYAASNFPMRARDEFERYLLEKYDVKVVPGSR